MKKGMKMYVRTTGCLGLRLETGMVVRYLERIGYEIVKDPEEADLILVSTCGVTETKERQSLELLESLSKYKKEIILFGCGHIINPEAYSKFNVKKLEDIYDFERLFPSKYKLFDGYGEEDRTFEYIPPYSSSKKIKAKIFFRELLRKLFNDKVAEWYQYSTPELEFSFEKEKSYRIIISRGCPFRCSYCAVWRARNNGKYKSISIEEVLKEYERGISLGYKKFLLVGDELGSYGIDRKFEFTIIDLLDKLLQRSGTRIGIRYIEPHFLIKYFDEWKRILRSGRIFYFCVPMQSASKRILKLMNRHYDPETVREMLKEIRRIYDGVLITHIMIGFPSETEKDFEESLEFVKEVEFDNVVFQPFSLRPKTKAEEIVKKYGFVDRKEVKRRIRKMDLQVRKNKIKRFLKIVRK